MKFISIANIKAKVKVSKMEILSSFHFNYRIASGNLVFRLSKNERLYSYISGTVLKVKKFKNMI